MSGFVIQITTDDAVNPVAIPEECGSTLKFLQSLVGGYIETVKVYLIHQSLTLILLVDEEGWIKDSPCNRIAADMAAEPMIFGDAVLCKVIHDGDGEQDLGFFTEEEAEEVLSGIFTAFGISDKSVRRALR